MRIFLSRIDKVVSSALERLVFFFYDAFSWSTLWTKTTFDENWTYHSKSSDSNSVYVWCQMLGLKTLPPITCILSGILAFSQTTVESMQASFNKFALYRCVSWCTFFCVPTRIYVDWSLGMNWMRSFEPWQGRVLRMLRTQMCVYRFSATTWHNQL